jgi:glycosyltransferase involved in cell wall biosynthesis
MTLPPPTSLIIIPAWNEEECLPEVLRELAETVPEHDILVVVDGATDRTAALARAAGVAVAELPFNLGIGGALRTGFRYAQRYDYQRAVQFDADGQHDPAEIKALLGGLDSGADMVVGSRFGQEGVYEVGRVRKRAMALLRVGVRLLLGRTFSDTSSGFRAFSRPVIEYFAQIYPIEYMDSVEALLLASYAGFRIAEVSVAMRHRTGGTPSNRNARLLYHYLRLIIVMISTAPLRRQSREKRP